MYKERRCMGCMRERGAGRFCKNCGFDNENPKNPERALPIGTILNGKYLIGAVIGEGGFGITYVAWDTFIQTRIAIKEYFPSELVTRDTGSLQDTAAVLKLTLIQEGARERYRKGLARFVEEAGNLARFGQLPGIVSVKDFFYENDTAYMVMEYIEGTTLATYLDNSREKSDVEKTLRMMEPVIKTLGEIHKAGIIHRDISPDNIMLTMDGQVKLIDFGAARFVGGESEKSLTVMLKHGYAPEEQYRSEGKQGAWTDVYALCAVIYRMLTGKAPEETAQRILEKQDAVHGELMRVPNLPGQVRKGIERGLSVRADKRFQTMEELYKGLYRESRGNSWKWVMGIDAVLLFAVCILVLAVRNRRLEPDTVVAGNVWEKMDIAELVEGEEKEREEEEQTTALMEEPEYMIQLREYYNMNYLGKIGKVYFVDMTGDGRDEMIVVESSEEKTDEYNSRFLVCLTVLQCKNNMVETIYKIESYRVDSFMLEGGKDCYLSVDKEGAYLLVKYWNAYWGQEYTEEMRPRFEKISLYGNIEETVDIKGITQEEFMNQIQNSILLIGTSIFMTPSWDTNRRLESYQDILECKEGFADAKEITKKAGESVLDYVMVYDGDNPCVLAVTGDLKGYETAGRYDYCSTISVWSDHNNQVEKVEDLNLLNGGWEFWYGCEVFQFGKAQHYFVELADPESIGQYKYCYENGRVFRVGENDYFEKNEDGTVQIEFWNAVEAFGGNSSLAIDTCYVTDRADIFYFDQQYVEYGAELVDIDILEQYENRNEVYSMIDKEFQKIDLIDCGQSVILYNVNKIELDHVRKATNGVLYLNYKVYGTTREYNYDYTTGGGDEYNVWAHVILDIVGNRLEYRELVFGKKEEYSDLGFPVYYGPDRELKPGKEN